MHQKFSRYDTKLKVAKPVQNRKFEESFVILKKNVRKKPDRVKDS